jgi:hypothetical protein
MPPLASNSSLSSVAVLLYTSVDTLNDRRETPATIRRGYSVNGESMSVGNAASPPSIQVTIHFGLAPSYIQTIVSPLVSPTQLASSLIGLVGLLSFFGSLFACSERIIPRAVAKVQKWRTKRIEGRRGSMVAGAASPGGGTGLDLTAAGTTSITDRKLPRLSLGLALTGANPSSSAASPQVLSSGPPTTAAGYILDNPSDNVKSLNSNPMRRPSTNNNNLPGLVVSGGGGGAAPISPTSNPTGNPASFSSTLSPSPSLPGGIALAMVNPLAGDEAKAGPSNTPTNHTSTNDNLTPHSDAADVSSRKLVGSLGIYQPPRPSLGLPPSSRRRSAINQATNAGATASLPAVDAIREEEGELEGETMTTIPSSSSSSLSRKAIAPLSTAT